MGVCCGSNKKEFYPDVENEHEYEIRNWEEKIGAFRTTFTALRSRGRFESNLISPLVAESFFAKEFSRDMVELINKPFFKEGDKYSAKKLNALIFLLSRPLPTKSGSLTYFDKAAYLIQEILVNEEDDLNNPIEENNGRLKNFCELLISVVIDGITAFYVDKNKIELDYFKEISKKKAEIAAFVIKNMYRGAKKQESVSFNFKDISACLSANTWFLSPGYFREAGYELAIKKDDTRNAA